MNHIKRNVHTSECYCDRHLKNDFPKSVEDVTCDCHKYFDINLAGLKDNLNYKLLINRHCYLEITTFGHYKIKGKTHHIGIDFVDINVDDDQIVTVLKDKIDYIHWFHKDVKQYD